ncbi:MAG TPA: hypothetical protein VFS10_01015, partial [Pyrinomonadaceae bacterium]|nr:hypothetical protein [Pyrinomonadaceae bacterium]
MRSSLHRLFLAPALACAILCPSLALRAQQDGPRTRPRRVTATPAPEVQTPEQTDSQTETNTPRLSAEPLIRIGLSTGARSVTVSTTGRLLRVDGAEVNQLELARVRIEPRVLPPLDAPTPDASTGEEELFDTASKRTHAPPNSFPSTKESKAAPGGEIKTARSAPPKTDAMTAPRGNVRLASRTNAATRGAVLYEPGNTKPLADVR